MLRAEGISGGYRGSQVLFGVDVSVPRVGTIAIVGRNGAGKTTLLRTLMGYNRPTAGRVTLDGTDVAGHPPASLVRRGVGYVPQEQGVFASLTVRENLLLGLRAGPKGSAARIEEAFELFPKLASRVGQQAGTMSGGERKMLAIARALLARPRILIMDEPTEGVWHGVVDEILAALSGYAQGAALLLVEQHLQFALDLADGVMVLDRGRVVLAGPRGVIARDELAHRLAP
ncbi:MAG: ABC transporter ATP-binding protein [Chloroflexi bacterium]|nr:ABC transporter ATP-binding protein [Chloroflexota bacterium]